MTVYDWKKSQKHTNKYVKAILTGPNTMLNWSFPRRDIS